MELNESGVTIFTAVYSGENEMGVVNRRKQVLLTNFATNVFKDELFVLYTIVKKFPSLTFINEQFLSLYLSSNKNKFRSERNIDLNRFVGEDTYSEFSNSVIEMYKQINKSKAVSDDDFELAMEMYRMGYANQESIALLQDGATIIADGMTYGKRRLSGFNDMASYVKRGISSMENIVNRQGHKGIVTIGVDDIEDIEEKTEVLSDYGIAPLDETLGGISEGDMISLLGISKGGKSKFMTYLIHRALMKGVNCVVWAAENGMKQFIASIRARHFDYLYNKSSDLTMRSFIDSEDIRLDRLEGQMKDKEAASWVDFKTNTNYGRLTLIDEPFELGSYIETLDTAVKQGGAKIVGVDYLQLMSDETGKRNRQEIVSEAYIKSLRYLKANKIAGLFPAQVKQTAVSSIGGLKSEELATIETRDIAGASYEVIKTPDVNMALVGSVEDIKKGHLKLVSCPSRNTAPFEPVDLSVDFKCCNFVEIQK